MYGFFVVVGGGVYCLVGGGVYCFVGGGVDTAFDEDEVAFGV